MRQATLEALLAARAAQRPVALLTELRDGAQALVYEDAVDGELAPGEAAIAAARQALRDDRSGRTEDGYFVQVFNPPLRMIVVGAVHIAQSLAPMASLTGYAVTLVDPRGAFATSERFPGMAVSNAWPDEAVAALAPDRRTAVVTLTHDPKLDDPALAIALRSEAFYIGSLGSKRTHAGRLERLREQGFTDADLARIHGPVGLAIGARSPAEVAIAILAEITRAKRQPAAPALAPEAVA